MHILTENGYHPLAQMTSVADVERKIADIKTAKKHVSKCHALPKTTEADRDARHFALMSAYNALSKARDALLGYDGRSCEQIVEALNESA